MTINHFATIIGVKRTENLYQVRKGNNKISLELAAKITKIFPEVDGIWLVSGHGTPFLNRENGADQKQVPVTINNASNNVKIVLGITITTTVVK